MRHSKISRRLLLAGSMAAVALTGLPKPTASAATAGGAAERVGALYGALLQAMQQAKQLGINGRYDLLAPVLTNIYDIPSMSRAAVGPSWASLDPAQQSGIVEAFSRMMVANYASQFDGFSGERFEILQTIDRAPTDKLVKTQIVQSNGKTVKLDYLMRDNQGTWKVVDVYLGGTISELASRRAEFTAIMKSGGASALINSLRRQGDKLLAKA